MPTVPIVMLARIAGQCLAMFGGGYEVDGETLRWRGTRPSGAWHVHGWTKATRRMLVDGKIVRRIVFKRRWRHSDRSGPTRHSRPPDDVGVFYDALLVALELWCWLDVGLGDRTLPRRTRRRKCTEGRRSSQGSSVATHSLGLVI